MMRRGVMMPEVSRVVRRRRDEQRLELPADSKPAKRAPGHVFPEPGAIEELFREARRNRP